MLFLFHDESGYDLDMDLLIKHLIRFACFISSEKWTVGKKKPFDGWSTLMVTHCHDSSPRSPKPVEIDVPDSITYPNNTPFVGRGACDPTRLQEERYQKTRVQKRSDDMVTSRTENRSRFNNNQQNHRHMYDTLMSTRIVTLTMTKLY